MRAAGQEEIFFERLVWQKHKRVVAGRVQAWQRQGSVGLFLWNVLTSDQAR